MALQDRSDPQVQPVLVDQKAQWHLDRLLSQDHLNGSENINHILYVIYAETLAKINYYTDIKHYKHQATFIYYEHNVHWFRFVYLVCMYDVCMVCMHARGISIYMYTCTCHIYLYNGEEEQSLELALRLP